MQQTFLQRAGDLVGETKPAAGSLQGLHVPSEDGPPPQVRWGFSRRPHRSCERDEARVPGSEWEGADSLLD